jgi:hypothetical protein
MIIVDISDNFPGFTAEAIECLAVLRAVKDPTPTDYARLKFGCACGSCINGFLSPRMKFALLCQAELLRDLLNEEIEDGKMWCMMHDDLLTHVTPDIQRNFATNKSYRQGFANLFDHVALTLRENKAPTIVNVGLTQLGHCDYSNVLGFVFVVVLFRRGSSRVISTRRG